LVDGLLPKRLVPAAHTGGKKQALRDQQRQEFQKRYSK